jgi:hypothetical protein
MSAWLSRPHLIDQTDTSFTFPNLRLEESYGDDELLSPFAHMSLQAQLGRRVSRKAIETAELPESEQISAFVSEVDLWFDELPPIFSITNPDLSLDVDHPYFAFQRQQLQAIGFMVRLNPLRTYLTNSPSAASASDAEFRDLGIESCLKLMGVAEKLFEVEYPINAKFHFVMFCIFDTAAVLCSAVVHNPGLPQTGQISNVLESAIGMLDRLSTYSRIGDMSFRFLSKLRGSIPSLSTVTGGLDHAAKRQRRHSNETTAAGSTHPTFDRPLMPVDEYPQYTMDQFINANDFGPTGPDIGGLEEVWDWAELNLDPSLESYLGQATDDPSDPHAAADGQ